MDMSQKSFRIICTFARFRWNWSLGQNESQLITQRKFSIRQKTKARAKNTWAFKINKIEEQFPNYVKASLKKSLFAHQIVYLSDGFQIHPLRTHLFSLF